MSSRAAWHEAARGLDAPRIRTLIGRARLWERILCLPGYTTGWQVSYRALTDERQSHMLLASVCGWSERLKRSPEYKGGGVTGDPREKPPTNGIVRHDFHVRKSGSDPGRGLNPVRLGVTRAGYPFDHRGPRAIGMSMEQRRNERVGETGDPRENPPTNAIARHDSHTRKSGVIRPGIDPGSPWWEVSGLTAQPSQPLYVRS
ncbi:hypothetical protein PR048_007090 [Dryococelus australis]|uniref:Uncharacterized protein n=1 Tax=Dryococelus australis TaxID=614101 RepID=A0ABQ9ICS1_9NEOP|nr:hypothetical protein PR048_007090 [Dryococelus australis]